MNGQTYCVLPEIAGEVHHEETTFETVGVLGVAATAYSLDETFRLHSLPGASKVIYLDFDGHTTSGTSWNAAYNGGADFVTPAYSFEGDASFSDAELLRIQRIWERVAEDFAPFNVDVTTEDPGVERLRKSNNDSEWGIRIVIGGSGTDWYGSAAGGVAYIGSFTWNSDTPAFVFENNLGDGNEKYTAEAISHEAGHTLGLTHDGTLSTGYYQGHGSGATGWAPIMGVGYYRQLTQWSRGEFGGATNLQDDLAIITNSTNGFGYRDDDHGNTFGTASSLSISGSDLSGSGLIERNTDVDVFWFDSPGALFTFDVSPWHRSPNLDVLAELYDAAGTLVASSNPISALDATITAALSAGRYFLRIDGVGMGDPASTGYSDYGSLGWYSIVGSFAAPSDFELTVSPSVISEDNGGALIYTFTRNGNLTLPHLMTFEVSGTAMYGSDFAISGAESFDGVFGTVMFEAGSAVAIVRVEPIADSVIEPDETVVLTVSTGSLQAVGTIENDDFDDPPQVVDLLYGYGNDQWMSASELAGRTAPWRIEKIRFVFDSDVQVDASDLFVTGLAGEALEFASFQYDEMTFTATWILLAPVAGDRLTIALDGGDDEDDGNEGVRGASGVYSDGEGYLSAGDYDANLDVLYGDVSGDGRVSLLDSLLVRSRNGTDDLWADISGDGAVSLLDSLLVRSRNGTSIE